MKIDCVPYIPSAEKIVEIYEKLDKGENLGTLPLKYVKLCCIFWAIKFQLKNPLASSLNPLRKSC